MKKASVTLFAVLACLLAGCRETDTSSPVPSSPISDVSATSEGSETSSEQINSEESHVSSQPIVSSTTPDSTTSSTVDGQETTLWSSDVVEVMNENLDHNLLPYVKLADQERFVIAVFNDKTGNVEISGRFLFDETLMNQYKGILEAAGWVTQVEDGSLSATLASKNLSLVFKGTGEEENLACIYARWNEVYDASSFTAWPQECLDMFDYWMNGNSANIPLIYVGAKYPTATFNTSDRYISVLGKFWQDDLVIKANSVLTAAGWTILVDSESSLLHIGAHKVMADGWEISLLLSQNIDGLPELDIFWTEAFQVPANGAWSPGTEDCIVNNLGLTPRDLPYLYLATVHETFEYNGYANRLRIHGGAFDSRIITDLTNGAAGIYGSTNGWNNNMLTDEPTGEASSAFVAYKTINGYEVTVKIYEDEDGATVMDIVSLPPFVAPANADWTTSTKQAMEDHLGLVLPYVYLGTTSEKNYWEAATSRLLIIGSRYESVILTNAKTTYEALGYTCSINYEFSDFTMAQEDIFKANKVITLADGSSATLNVQIENTYQGPTLSAKLSDVVAPSDSTDWSQDIKDAMLTNLGHNDIPYVYLGTDTPTYEFLDESNELDIVGSGFSNQMLSDANQAFTNDSSWTVTGYQSTFFSAQKTYDNGDTLYVSMYQTNGNIMLEIKLIHATTETDSGAWDDDLIDEMNTALNNYTLPYVFLGASSPEYMSDTNYLQIAGGTFADSMFTNAETAFAADNSDGINWVTKVAEDDYDNSYFVAYKRFADGTAIVVQIMDYGECAGLEAWYYPAATVTNTGSYSSAVTFDCGYTLPFITTGSESNVSEQFGSFIICGADNESYNNQYVFNAMDILSADNPNWDFTLSFDYNGTLSLYAVLDDSTLPYTVELTYEDDYGPEMSVYAEARETTGGDSGETGGEVTAAWSDEIQTLMTEQLGFVLPYFDMGSNISMMGPDELDFDGNAFLLSSTTYDGTLLDGCAEAFRNDTAHTWTVTMEEDDDYGCMMVKASTTVGDETISISFYGFAGEGMYVEAVRG